MFNHSCSRLQYRSDYVHKSNTYYFSTEAFSIGMLVACNVPILQVMLIWAHDENPFQYLYMCTWCFYNHFSTISLTFFFFFCFCFCQYMYHTVWVSSASGIIRRCRVLFMWHSLPVDSSSHTMNIGSNALHSPRSIYILPVRSGRGCHWDGMTTSSWRDKSRLWFPS